MSVKFFLYEAGMPNLEGKFLAKTLTEHAIAINELVERIAQTKTSLGKGDIRGVIETMCELIELEVTAGNSVQLGGICTIRPTIRGTFESISSGYDPTENSVEVAVAAGARLRKAVQDKAEVEKIGKPAALPNLNEYTDVATGQVNTRIDGGSIGQIDGTSLNFDDEQADEGLFLKDNIAATPVKVTVIQKASSSQIVFMVPDGEVSAESAYLLLRRRNKTGGPLIEGQSETMEFNPATVAV